MTTPLAHYLVRLGKGVPIIEPLAAPVPETPEVPIEQRLAEAAAQADAAGRAAATQEGEARIATVRAQFNETLQAERSRWAREEGERLAQLITAALHDLEQRIAASVASILHPFVNAALRERAIAALHEAIAGIVAHDKHAVLRISGPDDMLSSLRDGLTGTSATLDYVSSEALEVSVIVNSTIIETRLEAFQQRLQQSPE